MTDQPIRLNDLERDDDKIEWLNDLWRERADPLKRNGHSLDQIFWGVFDAAVIRAIQESLSRGRIASGLYGIAERHDLFGLSPDSLQARMADRFKSFDRIKRAEPLKKKPLPPLTYQEWAGRELGAPDFISGSWLSTTSRASLIAGTGVGKTIFAMQLAYDVSLGKDFLHWRGRRQCRVLYVDGEMSRRLFRDRVIACRERAGEDSPTFYGLNYEDVVDFKPLNSKAGQNYIDGLIERLGGIDLLVFDSIMCLLSGSMREEEPWAQALPWIKSLTKRNIGQIWIHHTGHDGTRGYGDKTREWQLDTVAFLTPEPHELTDVSFTFEFTKARERTPETRNDFRTVKIALINNQRACDAVNISKPKPISPAAQRFLDALNNVLTACNRQFEGRRAASSEAWQTECVRLGLIDKEARPDSARSLFSKYRRELVTSYRIGCDGDWSWTVS
jgi:hypothetical protein